MTRAINLLFGSHCDTVRMLLLLLFNLFVSLLVFVLFLFFIWVFCFCLLLLLLFLPKYSFLLCINIERIYYS